MILGGGFGIQSREVLSRFRRAWIKRDGLFPGAACTGKITERIQRVSKTELPQPVLWPALSTSLICLSSSGRLVRAFEASGGVQQVALARGRGKLGGVKDNNGPAVTRGPRAFESGEAHVRSTELP